jgi:hypothetical protein
MGEPAGGTRPMGEPAPNAGYRGAIERLLRAIREAIVGLLWGYCQGYKNT